MQTALDAVDRYIGERVPKLFALVIDHLGEVGEVRSCTEIEDHFKRNYNIEHVTTACEYLADQGLIGKASTAVRLAKKSNVEVQELAFFYQDSVQPPIAQGKVWCYVALRVQDAPSLRKRPSLPEHVASTTLIFFLSAVQTRANLKGDFYV